MTITATADEHARPLSEVISIVHDLRTPLSTIDGSAELLVSSALSDLQVSKPYLRHETMQDE
jgi:K+-sensing histidine kinase KdpD